MFLVIFEKPQVKHPESESQQGQHTPLVVVSEPRGLVGASHHPPNVYHGVARSGEEEEERRGGGREGPEKNTSWVGALRVVVERVGFTFGRS